MSSKRVNLVFERVAAAPGTGAVVLGGVPAGQPGRPLGAAEDAATLNVSLREGALVEIFSGVYTHATRTLSRGALIESTTGGRISFGSAALVACPITAQDAEAWDLGGGGAATDPEVVRDTIAAALVAGAGVTITPDDAANTITISAATDAEVVRDTMAAALVAGAGVTITPNDAANTITIAAATDAEVVRDTIAAALVAGAGVTITPNDAGDTITISATATAAGTDAEVVRDTMAAALVAGAGVTITPNDAGDTITISATAAGTDAEVVRDTIAAALVAGAGVTITPDDAANTITISATAAGTDAEVVRDTIAAALVAGAGVTITPDDAANTITISATPAAGTDAEVVRDTIAAALVAGAGVTITPDDTANTITISATPAAGPAGSSGSGPNAVAMIFDGDSRGHEAARRVLLANAQLRLNLVVVNQLSIGATESGAANNGAISAARLTAMANAVAAAIAAGYADVDVMLTTGGNDFPSGIQPEQTLANIRTYYNAAVAAGVRTVWVVGIYPASPVATLGGFDLLQSVNAGIRDLALSLPKLKPLMPGERMVDVSASAWLPLGGATGAFGAVTVDGTHDSFYGHLLSAGELEDPEGPFIRAFQKLSNSDVLDTFSGFTSGSQTPRGNLLGSLGRMRALGGTQSASGGTVTGTPPNGWALTGALAGLTLSFSTAASAELQQLFGAPSPVPVVRMTVSGTPTADVTLNLARNAVPSGGVPAGNYVHEMLAHGVGIQGLCGIGMTSSVAVGPSPLFGQVVQNGRLPTGPRAAADALPATTHAFGGFARTSTPSATSSLTATLYMLFKSGVAVSGSIDLAGASTRRVLALA